MSLTSPWPGNAQSAQVTLTYYNAALQATNRVQADGGSVYSEYYPGGRLKRTWGSRTYPVAYGYDAQGRMRYMTNWMSLSGGNYEVTRWNYDAYRGLLSSKDYPAADTGLPATEGTTGPVYTYSSAGRLATRAWLRTLSGGTTRLVTTYGYNTAGDLTSVTYNDNTTPTVTYTLIRWGDGRAHPPRWTPRR